MSKVIAAGTFDHGFGRNRRLISLLEQAGHEVVMCHVDLFGTIKYDIPSQRKLTMFARGLAVYPRFVWRFLRTPRADAVLVMYPGWFDMLVVGLLARIRRMPVVFDIYISLSDTIIADRRIASQRSIIGRASWLVDWLSIRSAHRLLADTPEHAEFYARLAGIPRDRVDVVWVGADDDVFLPRPDIEPNPKRVFFYGTFIKLHGVDIIVRAAKRLEADGIEFRIIGSGQEQESIERLIKELDVSNLEMLGRIPLVDLPAEIASAALCCGIFGTSDKAGRVVPNKVFECIAVGRPVVTGDTPGMRRAFSDAEVVMVPPGDPNALARAVRELLTDRDRLDAMAAAAHRHYLAAYSTDSVSRLLDDAVQEAIRTGPRSRRSARRRRPRRTSRPTGSGARDATPRPPSPLR